MGPWAGRTDELCSEIRAVILGAVTGSESTIASPNGCVRLSRDGYARRRENFLSPDSMDSAMMIVSALERSGHLARVFPDLAALGPARERLQSGQIPDGIGDIDRLVLDEAQDLTLVEIELLILMCKAVGSTRGRMPWILISGDEGQTVSPSGFDWGPLSALLSSEISRPGEFGMESKLRSPARISEVIDRTSGLYRDLRRRLRPSNQGSAMIPDALEAGAYHTVAHGRDRASALLEKLGDMEGMAVITLESRAPAWLTRRAARLTLTPEDVKGLEFRAVCLIDP